MEETREEKLRRWLEEKKAAKRAEMEAKNSGSTVSSVRKLPQQTPSTSNRGSSNVASVSRRDNTSTIRKDFNATTLRKDQENFSRFSEASTPVQHQVQQQRGEKKVQNELKTPVGREMKTPVGREMKTPVGRATSTVGNDSSVSQESLDRRRRLLERKTLVKAEEKPSASKTRTREAEKSRSDSVVKDRSRNEERGSVDSSTATLSGRRREAISRFATGSTAHSSVQLQDLQAVRDQLFLVEMSLLQWSVILMRLERTAEKRRASAGEQLLSVWGLVNQTRTKAVQLSLAIMKEKQAQQLHTQLAVQYEHFLPLQNSLYQFVENYSQLHQSIYSTTHVLPLIHPEAVMDEDGIVRELAELERALPDLKTQNIKHVIAFGKEMRRLGQLAKTEFDLLLVCKDLLYKVEMLMCQKRSDIVEQIDKKDMRRLQSN